MNNFYHEVIEIITIWRVTDFKKAAQEKKNKMLFICTFVVLVCKKIVSHFILDLIP